MNLKRFYLIIFSVFMLHMNGFSHEEPSKSLYERKQKAESKQKIASSGIKSVTLFKLSESETGQTKLMTLSYDRDGTYLSVEAFEDETLKLRVEYGYSKNGDMISDTDYDIDGEVLEKNTFEYDKQGRVVSGKSYEKNELSATFRFVHSNDKKQIEFRKFSSEKNPEYRLVYRYPENYDLQDYSEVKKIMPDGSTEMRVTKDYDKLNRVFRKTIYGTDGNLSYFFEYFYDDMGNNIKTTRNTPDGNIQKFDIFFYDPNGNITQRESYNAENELQSVIVYEFQYFE
jgi:hypothetical protein